MDKEVNGLKAMMEQTKNEMIRYMLGTLIGLLGVGMGIARLLL